MKKIIRNVLAGSLLVVSLLLTGIGISNSTKMYETRAATSTTLETGFFEKITDVSSIHEDDSIIIVSTYGDVFDYMAGNPCFATASNNNSLLLGEENEYLYLNSKKVQYLKVGPGISENTFAFYNKIAVVGSYGEANNGISYLGPNTEENHGQENNYKNVAWFMNGFGVRPHHDKRASWTLEYDSNHKVMKMANLDTIAPYMYLHFTRGGTRPNFNFCEDGAINVNLFRKKTIQHGTIHITKLPDKTTGYGPGDKIDMSGLEVEYRFNESEKVPISYNDHSYLFSSPGNAYSGDISSATYTVNFTCLGMPANFDITVNGGASLHTYTKLTTLPVDYRGSYILRNESSFFMANNAEVIKNGFAFGEEPGDEFVVNDYRLDNFVITIEKNIINDTIYYHAKNNEGKYFDLGEEGSGQSGISLVETPTANNAITITSNGLLMIGNKYLNGSGSNWTLDDTTYAMVIYKRTYIYDESDDSNEVTHFAKYFVNEVLGHCDANGNEDRIDSYFTTSKEMFEDLSLDAKVIFTNCTYELENTTYVKRAVQGYDYIIYKYHRSKIDYLDRIENGFVTPKKDSSNLIKVIFNDNGPLISIIIVSSVIILSSVGAYIFFNKKKRLAK